MIQAGIVLLGTAFAFSIQNYAIINMALTVVWLAVVVLIYREHRKLETSPIGDAQAG